MSGNKFSEKLRRLTGTAISEYSMIGNGDKVLVACSGGLDSTALILILNDILKRSPVDFQIYPVMLHQNQPGFNPDELIKWFAKRQIKIEVIYEDTYSIVADKSFNKTSCSLCARLRRGILYTYAKKNGFNKIALGHHRDDINETLLLNIFFEGSLATMPAVLKAKDNINTVIRPFCLAPQKLIVDYAKFIDFPIIDCGDCGYRDSFKRQKIRNLLLDLETKHPNIGASILGACKNIKANHLLDKNYLKLKED